MIEIMNRWTGDVILRVEADNLAWENLAWANLTGADLSGAYLAYADLTWANLTGANLTGANLAWANLTRADSLTDANLTGANLTGANLAGANLAGANLAGARYSVPQMLAADWGGVSDALCHYLMRYDASHWPDGARLISEWADGGPRPATVSGGVLRAAQFRERRECWRMDLPPITAWELWVMLAKEKEVKF